MTPKYREIVTLISRKLIVQKQIERNLSFNFHLRVLNAFTNYLQTSRTSSIYNLSIWFDDFFAKIILHLLDSSFLYLWVRSNSPKCYIKWFSIVPLFISWTRTSRSFNITHSQKLPYICLILYNLFSLFHELFALTFAFFYRYNAKRRHWRRTKLKL